MATLLDQLLTSLRIRPATAPAPVPTPASAQATDQVSEDDAEEAPADSQPLNADEELLLRAHRHCSLQHIRAIDHAANPKKALQSFGGRTTATLIRTVHDVDLEKADPNRLVEVDIITGVAYCSQQDRYVKKIGAIMAIKRLLEANDKYGAASAEERAQMLYEHPYVEEIHGQQYGQKPKYFVARQYVLAKDLYKSSFAQGTYELSGPYHINGQALRILTGIADIFEFHLYSIDTAITSSSPIRTALRVLDDAGLHDKFFFLQVRELIRVRDEALQKAQKLTVVEPSPAAAWPFPTNPN